MSQLNNNIKIQMMELKIIDIIFTFEMRTIYWCTKIQGKTTGLFDSLNDRRIRNTNPYEISIIEKLCETDKAFNKNYY